MLNIPAATFTMGSDNDEGYLADGEGPAHLVTLPAYRISPTAVSNAEFASFIAATGYRTAAEGIGWSFVFAGFLSADFPETRAVADARWWRQVHEADWAHPEGPHSDISARLDHPVVHVSWYDAQAYCAWSSTRLPTEAEWERAARGGLENKRYPWGDERTPGGIHRCNVWQGSFPTSNTAEDGYHGAAPVDAFEPNALGLYNAVGNVWEWCADPFDRTHHARVASDSPPNSELSPSREGQNSELRVIKGGSYLCHDSYCYRYRVAARSANTAESSTGHLGFRVAANA